MFAVVVVLGAAAGLAGGLLARRDAPDGGTGVRITYDVEDLVAGTHRGEAVELDRPLRSRRTGPGSGSATTESGVFDRIGTTWRQLAIVPPGEPGHDQRLTAPLAWAERQGLADRQGAGSFAGRDCTWWRTREPLDAGAFAPATAEDSTRSCVDSDGLLLADEWRAGGRDVQRRTATQVVSVRDVDLFDGTQPAPIPAGLVSTGVERLDTPGNDLVTLSPPEGLSLRAAARVVEVAPGSLTAAHRSVRAVYASSSDVLVVDQVRGELEARGESVRLDLGDARVSGTAGGLVVTVQMGTDQHLRVRTSLPYDDLIAWLGSLRRR